MALKFRHIDTQQTLNTTKFSADSTNTTYYLGSDTTTQLQGTPDVLYTDIAFIKPSSCIYTHAKIYSCPVLEFDNAPTANSDNLVKSGGIFNDFGNIKYLGDFKSYGNISPRNYQLLLSADGDVQTLPDDDYDTSDYIDVSNAEIIEFNGIFPATHVWTGLVLYDENKNKIYAWDGTINGSIELSSYLSAKWMRFSKNLNVACSVILRKRYATTKIFEKNIPEIGRIYPRNYQILMQNGSVDTKAKDIYDTSDYINISNAKVIDYKGVFPITGAYCGLVLYDSTYNAIAFFGDTGSIMLEKYPNAVWMKYTPSSVNGDCSVRIRGVKDNVVTTTINVGTTRSYTTIQAAINAITDASALNRYIVLVDEGDYDISNAEITHIPIKPYVNIIGVSKKCRIIQRLQSYSSGYNAFENVSGFSGEAEISNFTIITEKSKGALHLDSANWNGKIYFHDIECNVIENQEPYNPTLDYFKYMAASYGAVNLGIRSNQEIIIENVVTNGYIYTHTEVAGANNINAAPSKFVVKGCICDWIGVYSNGDKVRKTAIIENNRCNFIKVSFDDMFNLGFMTWDNIFINNNRTSFVQGEYKPYGSSTTNHNLWDEYYNKKMPCPDKSLHTAVQNTSGATINRGTKVKFTDYKHRYIELASDSNDFDAITVHTIENNQYGVVQDGGDLNTFWGYIQTHNYETV